MIPLLPVPRLFPTVHVIGNRLISDATGLIVGVQEPVIHVYNKNEASIFHHNNNTWVKGIRHRHNVILMGDSLGACPAPAPSPDLLQATLTWWRA